MTIPGMRLEQLHPNYVCQYWPHIKGFLEKGLAHAAGEYDVEQLKVSLVSGGQATLVVIDEHGEIQGACTIISENYPNMQVAFITAIGGRLIASPALFDQLKTWATNHGYTHIRGYAQESVARLWRQRFGYREIYRTVEYAL